MRREVMRRAHQLAKEMEGHYHARMALALRAAWAEARQPRKVEVQLAYYASGGREWVAKIVGFHPKYRFSREFLEPARRARSRSGRTGTTTFELEEGFVYEVAEPYRGRRFVEVRGGRIVEITAEQVERVLYMMLHDLVA